jgi:hypothetical protein
VLEEEEVLVPPVVVLPDVMLSEVARVARVQGRIQSRMTRMKIHCHREPRRSY